MSNVNILRNKEYKIFSLFIFDRGLHQHILMLTLG